MLSESTKRAEQEQKARRASKWSEGVEQNHKKASTRVSVRVSAQTLAGVSAAVLAFGVGVDEGDGAVVKNARSESSRSALNIRQRVRRARAQNAGAGCEASGARAGSVLNKSNDYARAQNERSESEMFAEREQTSALDKITQRAEGSIVCVGEREQRARGARAKMRGESQGRADRDSELLQKEFMVGLPNEACPTQPRHQRWQIYCPQGAYKPPPSIKQPVISETTGAGRSCATVMTYIYPGPENRTGRGLETLSTGLWLLNSWLSCKSSRGGN